MRKGIIILLLSIFLVNVAFAESSITFENISWLSDENATILALFEAGLLRNKEENLLLTNKEACYIIEDETGVIVPDFLTELESVAFEAKLEGNVKGKVGGYPIHSLSLTFAYDGSYQLIAVDVGLLNSDYGDMKAKLEKVYGKGKNAAFPESGVESTTWEGSDNTAVLLYTQSNGKDYTLIYGRLDAAEILQNCLAPADPDDVAGL